MMTFSESIKIMEAFKEGKTIVELPHGIGNVSIYVNNENNPEYSFDFYNNDYMVYVPSETVHDMQLEILQAYNEGKTIEFYDNGWWPVQKIDYKFDFIHQSYRIQPEESESKMTNKEWLKQHPDFEYLLKLILPLIPFNSGSQKNAWVDKLEDTLNKEYIGDKNND